MPKISFPSTGASYEVPAGTPMLDFCQTNETPVNFGCTMGSCGTCASVIECEEGAIEAASEDEVELLELTTDKPGARLVCLCIANGDLSIDPV